MNVKVKLVSMDGSPPSGFDEFGEAVLPMDNGDSVSDLLDKIALPAGETYMVLVNHETSPPSGRATQMLSDGDEVAVFPPMQGG